MMMKQQMMKCPIPQVVALYLVVGLVLFVATEGLAEQPCGQAAHQTAFQCSLCCAGAGFNKFDHELFQKSANCRCFTDQKEMEFNNRHKNRPAKLRSDDEVMPASG